MKKTAALILGLILCISLAGCGESIRIDFPFEPSDVENIELFNFVLPTEAEKKVITGQEDIEAIYELFESLPLKDKYTRPAAGGSVTSFRFNLSDGGSYELIYSSQAVKSGRIKTTGSEKDYFTSADIGANWTRYDYEILPAAESELPALY